MIISRKKEMVGEGFTRTTLGLVDFGNFSAVGYSKDHKEALIYLGHYCGSLCGTGHLVLLAKENETWP